MPRARRSSSLRQARRLGQLVATIHGRNRFYTRKLDEAGVDVGALRFPDDLARLPFTTKTRARCRSGQAHTLGHGADRADRALHALLPDVVDDWPPAPVDRHERELAVGARAAGRRCIGRRASVPGIGCSFRFRSDRSSGSGPRSMRRPQIGAHAMPAGGMSSQLRLAMIDAVGATVVCCTPTYALRLAEVAAQQGGMLERGGHALKDSPSAFSSWRVSLAAASPRRGRASRTPGAHA